MVRLTLSPSNSVLCNNQIYPFSSIKAISLFSSLILLTFQKFLSNFINPNPQITEPTPNSLNPNPQSSTKNCTIGDTFRLKSSSRFCVFIFQRRSATLYLHLSASICDCVFIDFFLLRVLIESLGAAQCHRFPLICSAGSSSGEFNINYEVQLFHFFA